MSGEIAWLPHARLRSTDNHWLGRTSTLWNSEAAVPGASRSKPACRIRPADNGRSARDCVIRLWKPTPARVSRDRHVLRRCVSVRRGRRLSSKQPIVSTCSRPGGQSQNTMRANSPEATGKPVPVPLSNIRSADRSRDARDRRKDDRTLRNVVPVRTVSPTLLFRFLRITRPMIGRFLAVPTAANRLFQDRPCKP